MGIARRRPVLLTAAAVLTLVLLVVAGVVVHAASARPVAGGAPRWDDFHRPDGPLVSPALSVLPSGQRWSAGTAPGSGNAGLDRLRIDGGTLRFDGPGAGYAWTTGAVAPVTASVDFVFEPGSSPEPRGSVGLIVSPNAGPLPVDRADGVASYSVHAGFGTDVWSIGIADGETLQIVASGRYRLVADGRTPHRAELRRTGTDTVEVRTPDGGTRTVTDPRIPRYWGPSVLVEHYQPIAGFRTDPRPVITGYAVDRD